MRYSRQEILLGQKGQKILQKSLVAIVGCGGTGSAAAEYLARAGVSLRLIDRDIVELGNLQRQLYTEEDIGKPKAIQLKEKLEGVNGDVKIEAVNDDLNQSNIDKYLKGTSLVLDGTDTMTTRFLVNDWCLKNHVPFTYAASVRGEGLFTLLVPKETACLQCFVPVKSVGKLDTCETAGINGPVAGMIGTISAAETVNFLSGRTVIKNSLLHINMDRNTFELIELKKKKDCPACHGTYNFLDVPVADITRLCGNAFQYIFRNNVDVGRVARNIQNNPSLGIGIISKSNNMLQLKYKDQIITVFSTRMIVQNIYSERAVKLIASKIIGL
ncbi:MAG TPA: HesA/MoeB/ThiF family protein [archaeon]|nr:HesA/MoeB/ThiF family protein [archaeon]